MYSALIATITAINLQRYFTFSHTQTSVFSYGHMTLTLALWPWYWTLTQMLWRRTCVPRISL